MPSKSVEPHETKVRLLNAAEFLIAERGISGTSLRDITDRAGVNIALVKYHFGSKDALVHAVMSRRLDPLTAHRMDLLNAVESRHPKGPLPLEEVLEALIRPAVEKGLSGDKDALLFMRLVGRLFAEPAFVMRVMKEHMEPTMKRFDAAFERALPGRSEMDMAWRKVACMGVVQHSLLMFSMVKEVPLPLRLMKGTPPSPEMVLKQLIAFCAAGMRVEVPAK